MHAGLMRAACYAVPCDPSVAPDPLLAVHQELDSNNLVRLLSGVTASSRSVLVAGLYSVGGIDKGKVRGLL